MTILYFAAVYRSAPLLNTRSLIDYLVKDDPDEDELRENWLDYARRCIAPALACAKEQQDTQKPGRLAAPLELFKNIAYFFNPLMLSKYVHPLLLIIIYYLDIYVCIFYVHVSTVYIFTIVYTPYIVSKLIVYLLIKYVLMIISVTLTRS